MKSLVSIIMNCYNGEKYLEESIQSILSQSYKNWELIFYDNLSSDNSKKILSKFNDKRIKYFKSEKFLKLYDARNKALELVNGDYISFLDTDDTWEINKLAKQVNFLEENSDYKLVYTNFFMQNGLKKKIMYSYSLPYGKITSQLLKQYTIGILTVCMSREILKNYKFNKRYEIIGDFDFFINYSNKSKIGCIQEALATARNHSDNLSKRKLKTYVMELEYWLKENKKKFKKESNFLRLNYHLLKQKIKIIFQNLAN